jgi:serine/threonine-protein kinase
LNLQCTAAAPPIDEEVRRGLPRGVEDMLFSLLEKKAEDRPASAREVAERLGLFRAAGTGGVSSRPSRSRSPSIRAEERASAAPPRFSADRPSEEHRKSSDDVARPESASARRESDESKKERSRTDTIALVEANARKAHEVPTWLAVIAIIALSLVAGMTTYLVRLKTANDAPPAKAASTEGPTKP